MPPAKRTTVRSGKDGGTSQRPKLKGAGGKPLESPPASFRNKSGTTPRGGRSQRSAPRVSAEGAPAPATVDEAEGDAPAPSAVALVPADSGESSDTGMLEQVREQLAEAEARHKSELAEQQRLLDDAQRQLAAASLPTMQEPVQVSLNISAEAMAQQAAEQQKAEQQKAEPPPAVKSKPSTAQTMIATELATSKRELDKLRAALVQKEEQLNEAKASVASHEHDITVAVAAVRPTPRLPRARARRPPLRPPTLPCALPPRVSHPRGPRA